MIIGRRIGVVGVLLAAALGGCGRSQANAPAAPATVVTSAEMDAGPRRDACPVGVEGARIAIADAPGGADLTLTASADRVPELRQRLRDAASLYGVGAHRGLGHHGAHLGAQRHGLRLTELPPLDARVEDVDGGARMHLRAKVPSQADELRSRLHARVEAVGAGPCD